jgi:hypothetical protein
MWRRGAKPACEVCKDICTFACSCNTTHYCSEEHQSLDWNQHKNDCQSCAKIDIKQRMEFFPRRQYSRTLVAQTNFTKGNLIYIENSILESPDDMLKTPKEMMERGMISSCIVCRSLLPATFTIVQNVTNTCSKCYWPLCNSEKCTSVCILI